MDRPIRRGAVRLRVPARRAHHCRAPAPAARVTLFNCFVMGTIPDDMGGIFDDLREAALTMQQGGGIGYDFSTLRPKGAPVKGVGADASGPLSLHGCVGRDVPHHHVRRLAPRRHDGDAALRPSRHRGLHRRQARRRAAAQVQPVGAGHRRLHGGGRRPTPTGRCVFGGRVYRTVQARDLWDRIMRATYDYAEPGVIFIDRINPQNNLRYCETIAATNPCGEQPLPPYGACLLGSINLAALVRDPFTDAGARWTWAGWTSWCRIAVRMMDNVDRCVALPAGRSRRTRPGQAAHRAGRHRPGRCADHVPACAMARDEAVALTEQLAGGDAAGRLSAPSAELAAEKGAFPLFDADAVSSPAGTSRRWPPTSATAIAAHGIRNALLTSIAPTGTISLFAGNVSCGIEPVFAFSYTRKVLQPDGIQARRRRSATTPTACSAQKFGDGRRPARLFRHRPDADAGRSSGDAGRGAGLHRQLDLQDHQLCRRTSPSKISRTSTCRPTSWAARAAPPTGPTTSPVRCCR